MAILHRAVLQPTKIELLTAWLPKQPWSPEAVNGLDRVTTFRFDDPAGEVGLEVLLVRADDGAGGSVLLQVPLTYRAAPLTGAESHLVGTLEHSVLGKRWVYDACADPVFTAVLAATILDAGTNAQEIVAGDDGTQEPREPAARAFGSGRQGQTWEAQHARPVMTATVGPTTTMVIEGGPTLEVLRRPQESATCGPTPGAYLAVRWGDRQAPLVLAHLV